MLSDVVYNSAKGDTMKTANITVKLKEEVKDRFTAFCDDVGLNPSVAINMFIMNVINNQKLPFEVRNERPNRETLEALKESQHMLEHPEEYKSYDSAEEMFKDLGL
jgi:DNA-damage-inducible protein J